jgi:hypothetical protein
MEDLAQAVVRVRARLRIPRVAADHEDNPINPTYPCTMVKRSNSGPSDGP